MLEPTYIHDVLGEIKFRLKIGALNLDRCILVHQMGKVGSSAIVKSLESLHLGVPVFHTHFLNLEELDKRIERHKTVSKNSGRIFIRGHLRTSMVLANVLKEVSKKRKWKIITLVRDPIARNVSAFFQNRENLIEKNTRNILKEDKITEFFFNEFYHDRSLKWLDLEIKNVFGFDLYKDEFPKSIGYKIYSIDSQFYLMIVRLEDLNHCHKKASQEFLRIKDLSLSEENIASKKIYSNIYREFIESLSVASWYIDKMYSSKYTKHFYSDSEIDQCQKKWLGKRES
jgi:Putative capsular polysaccharide synthesis protein/Sulfotransferase family